ncbi:MAG: TonB-dependent receptor [Candidatus Pseudobacter hemicellulosilyticus]|uniref:TonB-dependent receptor n=1 Tax=Candidatus Pseudobacter hemicellulosilyticus TaxID=3121375 RepID=A0AAJ5WZJ7_9BACT|nr:MAG: TonB-dependent receptor [Pseudobacter sp.]
MKLTAVFLVAGLLQVSAKTVSQQVTLQGQHQQVKQLLKEIRKQTGYVFFYKVSEVENLKPVSVDWKQTPLLTALNDVFRDQPVTYNLQGTTIYITSKPPVEETTSPAVMPIPPPVDVTVLVQDTSGLPLEGASVRIKGTTLGKTTDMTGYAVLKGIDLNTVLVISFTGYASSEVTVVSNKLITVRLIPTAKNMEDVVVIGYGTQKKISVSGAIAAVNSKELKQSPVANLSNALAGRLPGLISLQRSGEPGADNSTIYVRGLETYSGSQSPLILVDGVERSFDGIDANEVDNITILKDASSTAVYGVRGANGVVLITTKRGTASKPRVSVTAQTGLQSPTRLPEYLNSFETLTLYKEGLINDGLNASVYTDEYLNKFRDRSKPAYEYLYPDVDWMSTLLKDNSMMSQANLNVSGGSQTARYFVSLSYLQQDGLYKFDDVNPYSTQARTRKYNFRSNIDLNVTKDLVLQLNLGDVITDRNYPGANANTIFGGMKQIGPHWYPVTNPNGSVSALQSRLIDNPYGQLTQSGYQKPFSNNLTATAGFNLDMHFITKGLSGKARLSFDVNNYRNIRRERSYDSYVYSINDTVTDLSQGTYYRITTGNSVLSYKVDANGNRRTLAELYLNYDRTFGDHTVKGLFLYNQQSYMANVGNDDVMGSLPYKYQGWIGRFEYGFNNKYFGEFNFGYNGSENFPAGKRFGFFPAVSGSWVMSQESFFDRISGTVNLLKLRASYGVVGNDNVGGGRFLYQSTWSTRNADGNDANGYYFGMNRDGNDYGLAWEQATGNESVTWEKAKKLNIGLDLGLFNNQFTLSTDVFFNRRSDILQQPLFAPSYLGIGSLPYINAGLVRNRGFEVQAEYKKQYKNWGYFIKGNYSFARNKILDQREPVLLNRQWKQKVTRRIGEMAGLTALGLFKDWEDIQNSARQTWGAVQPGDIKYADLNSDGVIDELDEGHLNKAGTPEAFGGGSFGINYKNFDISVLFQGAWGGNVYFTGDAIWAFGNRSGTVLAEIKDNHYVAGKGNYDAEYPRMTSTQNINNYRASSFWIRSSDYIRLKNAEVGYTFSKQTLKRAGIESARFFVNGMNLITWSKIKAFDPEIPDGTGNYPQQKVVNAGLTFSF